MYHNVNNDKIDIESIYREGLTQLHEILQYIFFLGVWNQAIWVPLLTANSHQNKKRNVRQKIRKA